MLTIETAIRLIVIGQEILIAAVFLAGGLHRHDLPDPAAMPEKPPSRYRPPGSSSPGRRNGGGRRGGLIPQSLNEDPTAI